MRWPRDRLGCGILEGLRGHGIPGKAGNESTCVLSSQLLQGAAAGLVGPRVWVQKSYVPVGTDCRVIHETAVA